MKTLRLVIAVVFLATTLISTVVAAAPVLAQELPTPNMQCYGHVCWFAASCAALDPNSPFYHCTEYCYAGQWVCIGVQSCKGYC